jgi:hypothetical protein
VALPIIEDICEALPLVQADLCVTFPGAVEICALPPVPVPDLYALAKMCLAQLNTALAPLQPIFTIIETILAIFDCVQAIPDALGPPPDPSGLLECIPALQALVERILALVHAVSFLEFAKDVLGVMITFFAGCAREVQAIASLISQIEDARNLSPLPIGLLQALACADESAENALGNIGRALALINPIIRLLNFIGGPVGMPEIPEFTGTLGADEIGVAAALLFDVVGILRGIQLTIPAPDNIGELLQSEGIIQ